MTEHWLYYPYYMCNDRVATWHGAPDSRRSACPIISEQLLIFPMLGLVESRLRSCGGLTRPQPFPQYTITMIESSNYHRHALTLNIFLCYQTSALDWFHRHFSKSRRLFSVAHTISWLLSFLFLGGELIFAKPSAAAHAHGQTLKALDHLIQLGPLQSFYVPLCTRRDGAHWVGLCVRLKIQTPPIMWVDKVSASVGPSWCNFFCPCDLFIANSYRTFKKNVF